jgi:hypothetical protein
MLPRMRKRLEIDYTRVGRRKIIYTELGFQILCPHHFGFPNRAKGQRRITCPPRVIKAICAGMSRYANKRLPPGFRVRCSSPCW